MEHPDIELLTQFALDDPLALDAATLVHITDCEQCRKEIEQIQRVVDATLVVGGRPDLRTLVAPPSHVWNDILRAIDGPEAKHRAPVQPSTETGTPVHIPDAEVVDHGWLFADPQQSDHYIEDARNSDAAGSNSFERPSRRSTAWQLLAAAAVGLVLGIGVAWALSDHGEPTTTTPDNVASSTLSGIDGHDARGEVQLLRTSSGPPQLKVALDTSEDGKGFVEVWLLDAQTGGMVALGVLDDDVGTFTVPRGLDLDKYSQVDVSLEPFDGDPAHSTVSLARGPVP